MVQAVTFLNTELPAAEYAAGAKTLRDNGWQAVRSTAGNRYTTFYRYYEYLASTRAAQLQTTVASLLPSQLAPIYQDAQNDYKKYEMYVKAAPDLGAVLAPPAAPAPEVFVTDAEVETMQPLYAEMEQLLGLLGSVRLGGAKKHKRKTHKRRRHSKRRHTRRN